MNTLPVLTPRLQLVADMIRPGGVVADIGTDHALLPVYLVGAGHNPQVVASDIREGPLESARRTLTRYGAEQKVSLVMADGLDGVGYADDVVIAGMGGEQIASILGRCAFIRDARVRLVLQPMTALEELRVFLCGAGFEIEKEAVAREGDKLYVVMTAAYCGKCFAPDALFAVCGRLQVSGGGAERAYLERQAARLLKKARGMEKSARRSAEAVEAERLARQIEECLNGLAPEKQCGTGDEAYDNRG